MTGVYLITNTITGRRYVGQSKNIKRRFMEHRTPNASLKHKGSIFIEDIKKYGIDSFRFEVLEECAESQLLEREMAWIDTIRPEYNTVGYSPSEKMKSILSEKGKEQWARMSDEQRKRVIQNNLIGPGKGHPVSESTREKLRNANIGKSRFRVTVLETGVIYGSMQECADALGRCYFSVLNQLKGKTKTINGYHLKRVETNRDECSDVGRR